MSCCGVVRHCRIFGASARGEHRYDADFAALAMLASGTLYGIAIRATPMSPCRTEEHCAQVGEVRSAEDQVGLND
jgi:hypothetical protein